jgi:folylpolyglutamate synthase/dihydropteroate synthase
LICTSVADPRSLPPADLERIAKAAGLGSSTIIAADAAAAMRAAATHHGPVVVAGSLYLIGAVREGLMRSGVLPNEGLL